MTSLHHDHHTRRLQPRVEKSRDLQQAYVNAYTHLDQFADRARFSTWLTRIAVYQALGRLRRRRRVREVDVNSETEGTGAILTSGEPSPEQQALTGEPRLLLEGAVDALPRTSRPWPMH